MLDVLSYLVTVEVTSEVNLRVDWIRFRHDLILGDFEDDRR